MNDEPSARKRSMNMQDLEMCQSNVYGHEAVDDMHMHTPKDKKYMEHSAVFDEMVVTTNKELAMAPPPPNKRVMHRQSSVRILRAPVEKTTTNDDDDESMKNGVDKTTRKNKKQLTRRHSSYDIRHPHISYDHHLKMKAYLATMETDTEERKNFVDALLDFNMSVNLASMSDLGMMDKSPAMHYSCPVLSYMNDDEEDSIDLVTYKMQNTTKNLKRSAVCIVEETEEAWESLNDGAGPVFDGEGSREYQVQMKPLEPDAKPGPKRRRPPSCKILSDKLAHQNPQQVLRSFGAF